MREKGAERYRMSSSRIMRVVGMPGAEPSAEVERYLEIEDARLRELAEKAVAPATRRNYSADWDSFCGWCMDRGFAALPATPDTVARYLRWLIDRPVVVVNETVVRPNGSVAVRPRLRKPVKGATLRRHLVSIGVAHRAADYEDPTKSLFVKAVARGIRVERGSASSPKEAFGRDALRAALEALPHERLIDKRDRAIILFGWSGAFRRSEIAAVDVEHIGREQQGVDVLLPRSKTNQEGLHERVLIGYARDARFCAIAALDDWLRAAGITSGPVFRRVDRHGNVGDRIAGAAVAAVTKRFAAAAGLDERLFAAHSLRSGWITTAAREDKHERDMMRHSRHKSLPVFRGYVRQATKWNDHPGLDLL
jgi:integrase